MNTGKMNTQKAIHKRMLRPEDKKKRKILK